MIHCNVVDCIRFNWNITRNGMLICSICIEDSYVKYYI